MVLCYYPFKATESIMLVPLSFLIFVYSHFFLNLFFQRFTDALKEPAF